MKNKKFGNLKDIIFVNSITSTRLLGSFLVIPIFKLLGGISAAIFSIIFLLTDFIDGFLARKLNCSTFLGALLDGISDKIYGIIAFALLLSINPIIFSIPIILEIAIVITQNKKYNNNQNIKSNTIGKIKTWFLSFSIISSFTLVETLNLPQFIEYLKFSSLDKIATIKDYLILLGIELPCIITQLLTLKSYNKEFNENFENKTTSEETIIPKEEIIQNIDSITNQLETISKQKNDLEEELSNLEKIKLFMEAMISPEYYQENKDMPIRTLKQELFKKKK